MKTCQDCNKEIANRYAKRCHSCYSISRRGVKRPEYIGRKITIAKIGHLVSDKTRLKISISNKGKNFSPDTQFKQGQKSWCAGTKGIMKPNSTSFRKGNPAPKTAFTKERVFGSNNVNWKGGTSTANDKARHNKEIVLWRKACLERDNFTCQKTGQVGGSLVIHHINNFSDFPELRTSIENGITLSKESHLEFHKKYGKKSNTKLQLQEFLSTNTSLSPYFQELLINNKIK